MVLFSLVSWLEVVRVSWVLRVRGCRGLRRKEAEWLEVILLVFGFVVAVVFDESGYRESTFSIAVVFGWR